MLFLLILFLDFLYFFNSLNLHQLIFPNSKLIIILQTWPNYLQPWKELCTLRRKGGLGFKTTKSTNKALLAKLAPMIASKRDSLCMKILRLKYKDRHDPAEDQWLIPLNMAFIIDEIWYQRNLLLNHCAKINIEESFKRVRHKLMNI